MEIIAGNLYRKNTLLEVLEITDEGVYVQNEGKTDDRWIIPTQTFLDTYELAEPNSFADYVENSTFEFGMAIEAMKQGYKVAREGWNGKGMWLKLVEPYNERMPQLGYRIVVAGNQPEYRFDDVLPWIGMKTADNKFVPWLASQTDVLVEDWVVVQ
jgi:hypothetical protein